MKRAHSHAIERPPGYPYRPNRHEMQRSRSEPVPGHDGRSLQDVLEERTRDAPELRAAADVILALDQSNPASEFSASSIYHFADSDICQQAAELLLEFGQADLLLDLAGEIPQDYTLNIGASEQRAELLTRTAHKWPKAATPHVVLSASLPRAHLVGLHPFFQRPSVLHVHLTVASDCDPDAAQALACAWKHRQIGTFTLSAHPGSTRALIALQGIHAQAFTLQIPPSEVAQDAPFYEALVKLLQQSGATALHLADTGIAPTLGAQLVGCRHWWDSVTVRFGMPVFDTTMRRGGTIDRLVLCDVRGLRQAPWNPDSFLSKMWVREVELQGALELEHLLDTGPFFDHLQLFQACFMLPVGKNTDEILAKLDKFTPHYQLRHLPLRLEGDGYKPIGEELARQLNARPATSHPANTNSSFYKHPTSTYGDTVKALDLFSERMPSGS